MRDVVVNSSNNMYAFPERTVSIVNSYSIAYMLSSNKEGQCGLPDLFDYCSDDIEDRIEIPIEFSDSCFKGDKSF